VNHLQNYNNYRCKILRMSYGQKIQPSFGKSFLAWLAKVRTFVVSGVICLSFICNLYINCVFMSCNSFCLDSRCIYPWFSRDRNKKIIMRQTSKR
jgi:hypothetical protein